MLPNHYVYPAIFTYETNGISILFPDLPGCLPSGKNEEDAIRNATEALGLHLFGMEQDKEKIPSPSKIQELVVTTGSAVVLIDVFMPPIRDAALNKSIKKTLTIPAWLNYKAEKANVNFSKILQDSLIKYLNL